MKLAIKDSKGNPAGEREVKFALIENGRGSQAVHDTVVAYMAGQRRGTAATKRVGEVQGTNKKPWRQKGTGRARAGSFRSPLWRGGGVTHGPQPRDFSKKVNKKVAALSLRKALSERIKAGDVIIVDNFSLGAPKTKEFVGLLDQLGIDGTALVVIGGPDRNIELASQNLALVGLATGSNVNTYELLRYDKLVFTQDAFTQMESRLAD